MLSKIEGGVTAPDGFTASGIHCGIRKNPQKKDLGLIYSTVPCKAAGVYTQNQTKAAPLKVTSDHLASGTAQAIVCNSGNANACTADGIAVAEKTCYSVAKALGIDPAQVLVASTGVIGVPMPIEPIAQHSFQLADSLSTTGGDDFANAIMTTDTTKKEIAYALTLTDGSQIKIGGVAKGSGMIHPNMATMLGFITTDAHISQPLLQQALSLVVADSFNMISVDGDTSTNDMVLMLANGLAGNTPMESTGEDFSRFTSALREVCHYLAVAVASDGEGASKLLECTVSGGADDNSVRILAKSVITSSLFKAAMFGADANWGRVLCALGNAPVPFDPLSATVSFSSSAGQLAVCQKGLAVPFEEGLAKNILQQDKIIISIQLGEGDCSATAWGCDLTYDYVKINGDYRS